MIHLHFTPHGRACSTRLAILDPRCGHVFLFCGMGLGSFFQHATHCPSISAGLVPHFATFGRVLKQGVPQDVCGLALETPCLKPNKSTLTKDTLIWVSFLDATYCKVALEATGSHSFKMAKLLLASVSSWPFCTLLSGWLFRL